MWTYLGKQITIVINTSSIQRIQFDDGTEKRGFSAIKSFNRGIFVNPTLDKKKYLSLLKVFHPDVSDLDSHLATQIAQEIINAKDGKATTTSFWKTNSQSPSPNEGKAESQAKAQQKPNSQSEKAKYNWADWWAASTSQKESQYQSSRQQQKPPKVELDFETLLNYVPTNYWKMFGDFDTFERDNSVNFRIFKRCYYGYFNTELEIVFRNGCIYREKVTAIHRNCLYIFHQLNLNSLVKKDLYTLCEHEAIAYKQFKRKNELIDDIFAYSCSSFNLLKNEPKQHYWTLIVTNPRPVWKHKFIQSDYHSNFEQFNHNRKSEKRQQAEANISDYLNCGQYLKFKNQWLEHDEFLYFLRLTRNLAKELDIETTEEDGYRGYPIHILDLTWQKMSV